MGPGVTLPSEMVWTEAVVAPVLVQSKPGRKGLGAFGGVGQRWWCRRRHRKAESLPVR